MSSVLHPVGPEPVQTYWRRRALVLAAALVVALLVITLVANAFGGGSAVAAAPPPPPATQAPVDPSPSASVSPDPTPTPSASPSIDGGRSDGSPSPSADPTPSEAASSPPSAERTPAGPVACAPDQLRTTLTGKPQLRPKQRTSFRVSLINGSGSTCVVTVAPKTFGVTIYSGADRIWSSADCVRAVKPFTKKLADEAAVEWSVAWDGRRSAAGCKQRPEIPRPGTYLVSAKLKGADAVRLRVLLRD